MVVESVLADLDLEDRRMIIGFTTADLLGDSASRIRADRKRRLEPRV